MSRGMFPRAVAFVLCGLVLGAMSCSEPEPTSTATDEQAIRTVAQDWAAALSNGDMDGVMALWSEDAIEIPPGQARVGKAAIRDRFEEVLRGASAMGSISFDEVEVAGDWAFARGTFQSTWSPVDGGAQTQHRNDNLWIMRREADGAWRIARMMWNPTPTPAESP